MVAKVFRIVFISVLLFANAFAYFIVYSPNTPKHLSYIPDNATMVFSVNSKNIAGTLTYNALFDQENFSPLIEHETEDDFEWSGSFDNGLSLFGRITMMSVPDADSGRLHSVVLLDIADQSQLIRYLSENESKPEDLDEKNSYAQSGRTGVAFNQEVAVIITGKSSHLTKKKMALGILNKSAPSKEEWIALNDASDFTMVLHPGIEKMDAAPALKGMIGSFIHSMQLRGVFGEQNINMNYVLETDPALLDDASKVFVLHEHSETIPDALMDGIFNLHLSFEPERWVEWMSKGNLLNLPDSLKQPIYAGLEKSLGNRFVLEVDGVRILRLEKKEHENGISSVPVPDFKAAFSLKDPETVKALFSQLQRDSVVLADSGGVYTFKTPFDIEYHFLIQGNALAMSTTDRYITNPEEYFHGFSNWFYFNAANFIEAIPMESPIGFMIKGVMEEVSSVHYGYGFSTGTEANKVNFEGKLFYNDKKKHSLVESIMFIQSMAGIFVSSAPVAEEEDTEEEFTEADAEI